MERATSVMMKGSPDRLWMRKGVRIAPLLFTIFVLLCYFLSVRRTKGGSGTRSIIIPLSGRLGNQLFQFAAAEYIRQRTGVTPGYLENMYANDTVYNDSIFHDSSVFPNLTTACGALQVTEAPRMSTDCTDLDAALLKVPCLHLRALFQCHKVAETGLSAVRSRLARLPQHKVARETIARMQRLKPGKALVSLHIRRGDYTKRFNRNLLEPIPLTYYRAAMQRMPANSVFLVFSDDLKWCNEAFKEDVATGRIMRFMRIADPIEALLTMAMAMHHIIANSTFSWWGAFLNEYPHKLVIAPEPWFGPRFKTDIDLIPHDWIRMSHQNGSAKLQV